MQNSIEANDFMSASPVTFDPQTDIFTAIQILLQRKVSGATVIDENRNVIGVLSELDCLKAIIHQGYYRDGGAGTVADYMTMGNIDHISPNVSIIDAAQMMLSTRHRRIPIIENGKFMGQISTRSILRAFKDSLMSHEKEKEAAIA